MCWGQQVRPNKTLIWHEEQGSPSETQVSVSDAQPRTVCRHMSRGRCLKQTQSCNSAQCPGQHPESYHSKFRTAPMETRTSAPPLCCLPDAWHLGHSRSAGSLPTLENERGCLDTGFLQMVLLPRPSKAAVWETGALASFSQGWGVFWVPVLSPLPSWSDFVGHQWPAVSQQIQA